VHEEDLLSLPVETAEFLRLEKMEEKIFDNS
jgi:hypothetical protein